MIGKAPAVANPGQFFVITGGTQHPGAEIETTVFDVLRHHQPLIGEHAVQAAHRHAAFRGDPLRTQGFRLDMVVNQGEHVLELALFARHDGFALQSGFPMGPLELTDLIGQDVNFAVTCSVFNAFWQERRFLPSLLQQELVLAGRLGKKRGKGVYDWQADKPQVTWLAAPDDSYRPMRVERKGDGVTEIDELLLVETRGETAQALARRLNRPVVVVDHSAGDVVAIATAASNPHAATQKALFWLQQQGKRVVEIADYPGLLVWRTLAMIVNEALDALQKGVAREKDIDTAMRLGVNYPCGPIAWGERLGWQRLLVLLENLQRHYGEERYRPCSLLRQRALLESSYES